MNDNNDKAFEPEDLPENAVFKRKDIDQYQQPADSGRPIENTSDDQHSNEHGKEAGRTSNKEGLNEARLSGKERVSKENNSQGKVH